MKYSENNLYTGRLHYYQLHQGFFVLGRHLSQCQIACLRESGVSEIFVIKNKIRLQFYRVQQHSFDRHQLPPHSLEVQDPIPFD